MSNPLVTLTGEPWDGFGLIDSGHGRKFERYGPWRFIRPEPQAMWDSALDDWDADGEFVPASDEDGGGRWVFARPVPREGWELAWDAVRFNAQCTPFRHLGFFPDMAPVWRHDISPNQTHSFWIQTFTNIKYNDKHKNIWMWF